jgi:hypothetical protein
MSTVICGTCKHRKLVGVEMARTAKECRKCQTNGAEPMRGRRKERTNICESDIPDGNWHIMRRGYRKTVCGKAARETPLVRQGAGALLVLMSDVGACESCRTELVDMFSEALN